MELCACVTRTLCAVVLNEHLALNCHNYRRLCSYMKLEQLSRHISVNELLRKRLCKWRNLNDAATDYLLNELGAILIKTIQYKIMEGSKRF